jgi:hypothetical protein
MTIIDENGDFPDSIAHPLAQNPPAPSRATFGEAVTIEGDEVAGIAVVLERVRARVGREPVREEVDRGPVRYGSVSLTVPTPKPSLTVGRERALDLAAGLLELADALRAAGMVLEGLALEGLQARLLEGLIGAGR